ncbi:MAG: hypothetical protein ACFCVE_12355 [Phycisphaerae bacterium]
MKSETEWNETKRKLVLLENLLRDVEARPMSEDARRVTRRSILGTIKDLKEDAMRYEAQRREAAKAGMSGQ